MKESRNAILLALFSLSLAGGAVAAGDDKSAGATGSGATASGSAATMQQGTTKRSAAEERAWERQHRASKIIGTDVHDLQGKKVGEIRDVVIDPARGDIDYAVVSFGGVMGVGSKYFAVPWKSLQATSDASRYMLNVDREALKTAPGFDRNNWPDMASQQWKSEVERYWEGRTGATSAGGAADQGREAAGTERSDTEK